MIFIDVDEGPSLAMIFGREYQLSPFVIRSWLITSADAFLGERVTQRFANEGDDAVGVWPQLRMATAGIRKAQGYGPYHPINRRTDQLLEFVRDTNYVNMNPNPTLVKPGKAGGKLMDKFRTAQKGGGNSKVKTSRSIGPNMPAPPRPVIALSATDEAGLTSLLMKHVLGKP